jgi:hypothetical protein
MLLPIEGKRAKAEAKKADKPAVSRAPEASMISRACERPATKLTIGSPDVSFGTRAFVPMSKVSQRARGA